MNIPAHTPATSATLTPYALANKQEKERDYSGAAENYKRAGDQSGGHSHAERCYAAAERCAKLAKQPDTLPAFRPGAPVRVKIPAGHEPSAYNGERGTLVCQDGDMWQVVLPQHGLTRAFYPDELTVLE